jgi:peroxiredoxin
MKKVLLIVSLALGVISCSQLADNEYLISGTADKFEEGQTVILEKISEAGMGFEAVDSAKITNGKFEIKGTVTEPEIYLLQVKNVQGKIPFVLENGEIVIEVNKDTIANSKKSGTYNNEIYQEFEEKMKVFNKTIQKDLGDFQQKNMAAMQEAQATQNMEIISKLQTEYKAIIKKGTDETVKFAESHPKAFITVMILEGMTNQPDAAADLEKITAIFNSLDDKLKNTKPGKEVKTRIDELSKPKAATEIGDVAPDFSAPNPEGKVVSLKESLGKVTIIDFWASWCGPCRKENPNMVALYNDYKDKGLNIIGVSLDRPGKADDWKQAIANDKLTWTHISNLKHWEDPIAKMYRVEGIPATYVLDEKGVIVAKNLSGDVLKAKIKELLGA